MQNFRSLKRDCLLCGGARSDCRQNTQNNLVHCRHDIAGTVSGFRFVGVDALGFNMWAIDDGQGQGRDGAGWETRRQQIEADRSRRLREETELYSQLLSADERDFNIRKIHAQVGLLTRHRQNLRDRGLTDVEIDAGKFFTISPWQEIAGINPRLAGVDLYGRKLQTGQAGFACPITDVQGRIIGWQTRFDDDTEGGKYRWPTSKTKKRPNGATSHLQNGELPIACCRPVGGTRRNSIGLAEGFLKPYVAAQSLGQIIIGAAGGNFTGSRQQLKAYLDALSAELNTTALDLYPDAGAIANNAVMRHYEQVIQMVSEWGYSISVGWWGQVDKSHPDIDELPNDHEIAYLTPDDFLGMGERTPQNLHSFGGLLGWLPRLVQRLGTQRKTSWGFGSKGEQVPPPIQQEVPKYEQGERLDVWQSANHLGYRHVLDSSATGLGKSFDAGRLTPEMFPEARQIIYASREHRNPSTPTLESWEDLEARHEGLYRDEFKKLRRVDKNQPYVVPPNCGRNKTIGALRSKNIPGADTADLVCRTCPHFEPCRAGATYDYLNQRAKALAEPRLRAHPDSLPDPDEYDYEHVVVVWEEAGEILKAHRSIEVRTDDLSRTMASLCAKLPVAFDALRPLLNSLHLYVSGEIKQPNKYGWDDAQVRSLLPELETLDLETIKQALLADPERILNTTKEHGVDSADLPRGARKMFTERDGTTAEQITKELALNWLPDFLDVLLGNTPGTLRIKYGVLTISLGNDRKARIALSAGLNIYLDATATAEDIGRAVRLPDLNQLLVTQQSVQPLENLEVIQVTTLGRLGLSQRSDYCQERVDAVVAQFRKEALGDVAVIDFKRHTKNGDGKRQWWVDSRGINDMENCQTLILTGTPCPNLGDSSAEFTVLYGRAPKQGTERIRYPVQVVGQLPHQSPLYFEMEVSADPEFREFLRRRSLAAYHQAIGRLRAHRRSGEKLRVVVIADYPLDLPVTLTKASAITPEAATKTERFEMAIKAAAEQLKATGEKITQSAIAQITGYSQQYISRFRFLLLSLLDGSYSKSSKNGEPLPDPEETQWWSSQQLPLLADSPPPELLEGVLMAIDVYGQAVFKRIWDAAPVTAQIKILQTLALTLPAGELRALALAVEAVF